MWVGCWLWVMKPSVNRGHRHRTPRLPSFPMFVWLACISSFFDVYLPHFFRMWFLCFFRNVVTTVATVSSLFPMERDFESLLFSDIAFSILFCLVPHLPSCLFFRFDGKTSFFITAWKDTPCLPPTPTSERRRCSLTRKQTSKVSTDQTSMSTSAEAHGKWSETSKRTAIISEGCPIQISVALTSRQSTRDDLVYHIPGDENILCPPIHFHDRTDDADVVSYPHAWNVLGEHFTESVACDLLERRRACLVAFSSCVGLHG